MKLKFLIFLLAILISGYVYNNFFSLNMLAGKYVNSNYEMSPFPPNVPDTMIIYSNGEFYDGFWGEGKCSISHSFKGTRISIDYNNSIATSFETTVTRKWFGAPRIIVEYDIGHCYKKID